jgi:hypothetical protein
VVWAQCGKLFLLGQKSHCSEATIPRARWLTTRRRAWRS